MRAQAKPSLARSSIARITCLAITLLSALALSSPAAQAAPPIATIAAADNVTPFTATLHGEVDPGGVQSECRFEYSTDTSFANSAACAEDPGAGTGPVPVHADLSGLAMETAYNFHLVASQEGGAVTDTSGELSFSTPHADAPVATVAPADSLAPFSATLHGIVDPEGSVTECHFIYSTDASFSSSVPCAEDPGAGAAPVAVHADATGLNHDSSYVFRLVATKGGGALSDTSGIESFATTHAEVPTVTILPANPVTATSATLHGEVNPEGFATTAHFEYSADGGANWTALDDHDSSMDPGLAESTTPVALNDTIAGLAPNASYLVRLVATNPAGPATSGEESFTTAASAPAISDVYASDVFGGDATLHGTIDPHNLPTTYHFEFGITTSYGAIAPVPAAQISIARSVFQVIGDLQPDATYHYRLVAENAHGVTEGPDRTFTTAALAEAPREECPNATIRAQQLSTYLPDCRAYEQVSPVDKNGTAVVSLLRTSSDGQGVAWTSQGAYGEGIEGSDTTVPYAARRGAAGWVTTPFHPRFNADVRPDSLTPLGGWMLPDDLSSMAYVSTGAFTPNDTDNYPGLPFGPLDVFRVDGHGNSTLLSHAEGVPGGGFGPANFSGMSDDGTTTFFVSSELLTTTIPPTSTQDQLYRWRGGHIDEVGYDPSGIFLEGGSWLGSGDSYVVAGAGQIGEAADSAAISSDGHRFVFGGSVTGGSPRQVYLHIDGAPVRQLSISQRSGALGAPSASNAYFIAATPSFEKIYFQSDDQLSDDAPVGGGLYVYDVASGLLSFSNPDQSPYINTLNAGGDGLTKISNNGAYVYFVSPLALASGAIAGKHNLYVQHDEVASLIAITADTDVALASTPRPDVGTFNPDYTSAGLDDSGTRLVFDSTASLAGADTNGHSVVYLYDAVTKTLNCISCPAGGGKVGGDSGLRFRDAEAYTQTPTVISADGSKIVFTSADDLLPQDTNGVEDVYEWHDGQLGLVSSGQSGRSSFGFGMGNDGGDILFKTTQSLLASDIDGGLADIYDARVGGGEAIVAKQPSCRGDECQGPPSLVPTLRNTGDSFHSRNPSLSSARKLSRALKQCRKKRTKAGTKKCKSHVRKRFHALPHDAPKSGRSN